MAQLRSMEDYYTHFDPKTYLDMFYKSFDGNEHDDGSLQFFVKYYQKFWSNFSKPVSSAEVRLLEYGGGPCITNFVSACLKVDHIVFAEYTKANRDAVKSWIAGDPEAHDWTPFFEVTIRDLEGLKPCESDAIDQSVSSSHQAPTSISQAINERSEEVRKKIKSIVPCDVTKTPIVEFEPEDIGKPFDVVCTSLCLEACVTSQVHYKYVVAELCKLLKPNGYLVMNGVLQQTFYCVGKEKFYGFFLSENMVKEAMIEAGIKIEKFETIATDYSVVSDCKASFFTYGRKSA